MLWAIVPDFLSRCKEAIELHSGREPRYVLLLTYSSPLILKFGRVLDGSIRSQKPRLKFVARRSVPVLLDRIKHTTDAPMGAFLEQDGGVERAQGVVDFNLAGVLAVQDGHALVVDLAVCEEELVVGGQIVEDGLDVSGE